MNEYKNECEICAEQFDKNEKFLKHLISKHCIAPEGYFYFYGGTPLSRKAGEKWWERLSQKLRKDGFVYVDYPKGWLDKEENEPHEWMIRSKRRRLVHELKIEHYYHRRLEDYEIPYHLDGCVSNNDIRNLAIFPFAEIASKRSASASGKHSRRKGKRKEREVAKILQEWWGTGDFRPTPSSGGWDKGGDFKMKGDIVTTDEEFPFCVEIKNNEAWKFSTSLVSTKSVLHKFWEQTREEAEISGLQPLTIFTRNHLPLFAMLHDDLYRQLGAPLYGANMPIMDVHVVLLDDLLKLSRETIIERVKSKM